MKANKMNTVKPVITEIKGGGAQLKAFQITGFFPLQVFEAKNTAKRTCMRKTFLNR